MSVTLNRSKQKAKRLPAESNKDKVRLMLYVAAAHYTPSAQLQKFAEAVGVNYQILYRAIKDGHMSPEYAKTIEDAVGRDLIQKEVLCPKAYA